VAGRLEAVASAVSLPLASAFLEGVQLEARAELRRRRRDELEAAELAELVRRGHAGALAREGRG
jgi:hypothetical protein